MSRRKMIVNDINDVEYICSFPWHRFGGLVERCAPPERRSYVQSPLSLCEMNLLQKVASSLTMEVEGVTHAIQWLTSQRDAQITHAIILTDSMNLLQKVESGMGCPDWHTAMHSLRLQRLLWIYCPGHAGVSGNERADRLASTADITSGLQLGREEVLRGLRNFLNMDRLKHHSIDRLKER